MLQKAIEQFQAQSYPNKQMIIIYQETDNVTCLFLDKYNLPNNVKCFCVPKSFPNQTLGDLRNISLNLADGEYVCQWDDDDCYHKDRLKSQYEFIINEKVEACVLEQWIVYDCNTRKAYLSNKRFWEGSLLCKTDIARKFIYPSLEKGEDSSLISFLLDKKMIKLMPNNYHLYIYKYHGKNTWDATHFEQIFKMSEEIKSKSLLKAIEIYL